ncbi:MAG: acyltransferase, partial [Rhodospirillaceae bacterium]|nr:acyltransferase [Rhodospirillaceae bacterium]
MSTVKAAVIQMELKADPVGDSFDTIRDKMTEAHMALIEDAASKGVQVIGLQEVWTMPYFPAEKDERWFGTAEMIPEGPTTQLMMETAKRLNMVIVSPIYELGEDGKLYNTAAVIDADGRYLGKFRKIHIPKVGKFDEKYYFADGNLGFPVFETAVGKVGVYICY